MMISAINTLTMALQYLLLLGMSYPTWHLKLQVTQSKGTSKERVLLPGQLRLESLPRAGCGLRPIQETVVWHSSQGCGRRSQLWAVAGPFESPECASLFTSLSIRSLGVLCTRADSNSSGGLPFGTGLWIMNLAVQVTLETTKPVWLSLPESPKAV